LLHGDAADELQRLAVLFVRAVGEIEAEQVDAGADETAQNLLLGAHRPESGHDLRSAFHGRKYTDPARRGGRATISLPETEGGACSKVSKASSRTFSRSSRARGRSPPRRSTPRCVRSVSLSWRRTSICGWSSRSSSGYASVRSAPRCWRA